MALRLSKRCEYGLRALIDLAIARRAGRTHVSLEELARHESIPRRFLEQVLLSLREAGWVEGRRGPGGGYALASPAGRVRMGDVIRHLDGPLAPISCVSRTAYARCSCPDEAHCGLRLLMTDVRTAVGGVLDGHSLADVVEITVRKLERDGEPLPFAPTEGRP